MASVIVLFWTTLPTLAADDAHGLFITPGAVDVVRPGEGEGLGRVLHEGVTYTLLYSSHLAEYGLQPTQTGRGTATAAAMPQVARGWRTSGSLEAHMADLVAVCERELGSSTP